MKYRCFLIAACLAMVVSPAFAGAPKQGSWIVEGADTAKWKAKMILRADKGKGFSGYFIWTAPEEGLSGDELFVGNYNAKTNSLTLTGVEARKRNGIALGTYTASVSADGKQLDGRWGSSPKEAAAPGVWKAKWVCCNAPLYEQFQSKTDCSRGTIKGKVKALN